MDWHFRSWVPFLSRLCPSDRCRIWKRGNRLRVDSSLMGVDVEKLNWIRGNISYIFHVHEQDSKMFVVDHDRRLYEEIDKMRDFTPDEVDEDLSSRLNSQIYSGKIRKPHAEDGSKRLVFVRQQGGLFGLGGDREEEVGPYQTKVYDIPNVEVIARYRKEHLQAREAMAAPPDNLAADAAADAENGSLKSDQVLQELESAEPQVQGIINDARKNLYTFAPSLPRPPHLPSVTATEYFATPSPYMHAGRRLVQSERSKHFTISVWMAENFPLTVHQLMPFLEMMALGNKNFEKVQEIVSMDLPPGFPIRIEIPLFAFLAAQITFLNFGFWGDGDDGAPPPAPQFAPAPDDPAVWFDIPSDYAEGVVIKNILKDS